MNAFEAAVGVTFADPHLSRSAGYRMPEGGPFVPCRVTINQQRQNQDYETGRVQRAGHIIKARAADLSPALGGQFLFEEPALGYSIWKVTEPPVREDRLKLIWTCAVSPG